MLWSRSASKKRSPLARTTTSPVRRSQFAFAGAVVPGGTAPGVEAKAACKAVERFAARSDCDNPKREPQPHFAPTLEPEGMAHCRLLQLVWVLAVRLRA